MDFWFLLKVVWAFALIAVLLVALLYVVRALARGRLVVSADRRLVTVVESTFLAQHTTVHVIKVAERYYLVGGGSAGVAMMTELPANEVGPFIAAQRRALADQREAVVKLVDRVRRRSK